MSKVLYRSCTAANYFNTVIFQKPDCDICVVYYTGGRKDEMKYIQKSGKDRQDEYTKSAEFNQNIRHWRDCGARLGRREL